MIALNESGQVTLDGSGNGTVKISPDGPHEQWYPASVSVKATTNTNEATCKIYVGSQSVDSNFVDGTFSGSSGDSSDRVAGYIIGKRQSQYIIAVWAGGDAGATATLSVVGTKELG